MLKISLIIPTYNRPDELTVALRSVLEQTRLPDELVIVDDGGRRLWWRAWRRTWRRSDQGGRLSTWMGALFV